ncbi:MAG TPA: UDP-N-acetylmuramoyl-L-alanyl-D-glutamate--2,6-diaminopimelate ligase [Candidatus Lumbricidophila sp.]|nr:UDP-N-acetylmuramoyl-L-alanyl-D-glutamate--2,6-diaminopimelate ligase [Candidatus Lumbricidophila sp.]
MQSRSVLELAQAFNLTRHGVGAPDVKGVSVVSSETQPGDLYVALPGRQTHGARYAAEALSRGAAAVLTDPAGADLLAAAGVHTAVLVADHPRSLLGAVSSMIYDTASLPFPVIAATGTNGKTSVLTLANAILAQLGVDTAQSTTVERRIRAVSHPSALTTPEACDVHAFLSVAAEAHVGVAAVEVSAQALTNHRVDGVVFDVVGFTNLTHDHLDDYGTMERYFEAKRAAFDPQRARCAVINIADEWGRRLAASVAIPVVTIGADDADWRVEVLVEHPAGVEFRLTGPAHASITTSVPLVGAYMAENAALAIVMLLQLDYPLPALADAFARDGGIVVHLAGRTEVVSGVHGPTVLVDYAHTPNGIERMLEGVRRSTAGRIVVVLGADGDRDPTKRAAMGAAAARFADALVITDFNPRFEAPGPIRAALIAGALAESPDRELYEVADPVAAIHRAIELAHEGDTVVWAGPGPEQYHDVQGVKHPMSARDEARRALRDAGWSE